MRKTIIHWNLETEGLERDVPSSTDILILSISLLHKIWLLLAPEGLVGSPQLR